MDCDSRFGDMDFRFNNSAIFRGVAAALPFFCAVVVAACGTDLRGSAFDVAADDSPDSWPVETDTRPTPDSQGNVDTSTDSGAGDSVHDSDSVPDIAGHDESVLPDSSAWLQPLEILSFNPESGDASANTTVTIRGTGFSDPVQVWFGRSRSPSVFVISDRLVNCVAPPGPSGPVELKLADRFGREASAPNPFIYRAAVSATSVSPASGPASGGTPAVISGTGFLNGVRVFVGGRPVISQLVASDSEILIITPPGEPGSADVRVVSTEGESRLRSVWTYLVDEVVPTLPGVGIDVCSPASGSAAGGTSVTIAGSGFRPGMGVRIGALPCPDVKFVSESLLQVVTPPGSPGSADVTVSYGFAAVTLENGFFFRGDDGSVMGLFEADPPEASWSGNALVSLKGFGLSSVASVWFGSNAAVIESVSDSEIVVRTPRSEQTGTSFIMALGEGGTMIPDGFRFFDPYTYGGGVWGPAVDGTLNVTVFGGVDSVRMPNAFVIVGGDPHTKWQGLTDDRGQITFSDRDLVGPLAVSATSGQLSATTYAGIDGRNVTLMVAGPAGGENPSEPPPVDPPDPCIVSGRVSDYGKYFVKPLWLDGDAWVECFPSAQSMYSYLSTIPIQNRPDSKGRFSITARSGEFAVICRLVVQEKGAAEPRPISMGIRRHVRCVDGVAPDVTVSLDISTDSSVTFGLDSIPWWPTGTWEPRFTGGWLLGTDGYFPLPARGTFDGTSVVFSDMPARWDGDGVTDLAGEGFDLYVTVSSKEQSGMPYSVVQASGIQANTEGGLISGIPGSFEVMPVSMQGAWPAFVPMADGSAVAVDDAGRTWILEQDGFRAGPVVFHSKINDIYGDSPVDFIAVGPRGRLMRVSGGEITTAATGFSSEFFDIDGEDPDGLSIAAGPMLLNLTGDLIRVESIPPGSDVRAVRRFADGTVFAVGPDGLIVTGRSGEPMSAVRVAAEDLTVVAGDSASMVWAAGESGRVVSIRDGDVAQFRTPSGSTIRGILVLDECEVLFFGEDSSIHLFDCFGFTDVAPVSERGYSISGGVLIGGAEPHAVMLASPVTRLPAFAGFPTISRPAESALWDGSTFTWESGETWGATHCQAIFSDIGGNVFWQVVASGDTGLVQLPDFGRMTGTFQIPAGPKRINLTCSKSPGFDINNYDYRSLNYSARETYSVDLASFY